MTAASSPSSSSSSWWRRWLRRCALHHPYTYKSSHWMLASLGIDVKSAPVSHDIHSTYPSVRAHLLPFTRAGDRAEAQEEERGEKARILPLPPAPALAPAPATGAGAGRAAGQQRGGGRERGGRVSAKKASGWMGGKQGWGGGGIV